MGRRRSVDLANLAKETPSGATGRRVRIRRALDPRISEAISAMTRGAAPTGRLAKKPGACVNVPEKEKSTECASGNGV